MKLNMTTHPYRLEQGYELGYGPSAFPTLAEMILAFREPEQDVIFDYINWDNNLDPHKDQLIQEALYDYHNELIHDPDGTVSQRVKEVLLQHYAPDRDPQKNTALMDQLLAHYKQVPLDELNEELTRKIGAVIHGHRAIYTLEDQDADTQSFINDRLAHTNTTWLLPYERPVYLKNILWYRVNTKEDILTAFEKTDSWFTCAIVNPGQPVEDYTYFLNYTEEHDGMALYISTRTPDHFRSVVLPKLQALLPDLGIVQ
ncbi:hypothetical protein FHS18_005328 [Paenibacillus phyllosphaerae]|uniref:Uncharacterized protein n=1 Tax=Paenibacillus phyllosphaerae TaxID=274593 RepID=A0A7W5B2G6_9BACL|nr:hypothetical protein [Paenibacillus phyllosphaerae]MBB3113225.1 hypothetical protein [Paenibacillus phyllosphaerae]